MGLSPDIISEYPLITKEGYMDSTWLRIRDINSRLGSLRIVSTTIDGGRVIIYRLPFSGKNLLTLLPKEATSDLAARSRNAMIESLICSLSRKIPGYELIRPGEMIETESLRIGQEEQAAYLNRMFPFQMGDHRFRRTLLAAEQFLGDTKKVRFETKNHFS